jgi:hypothetical protein
MSHSNVLLDDSRRQLEPDPLQRLGGSDEATRRTGGQGIIARHTLQQGNWPIPPMYEFRNN